MCDTELKKKQVLDIINDFESKIDNLEVDIIFINSNFSRKNKYKEYKLLTDGHEEEIYPTIRGIFDYISNEILKRSFEKYDLELSMDETVQIVEKTKVINGNELLYRMDEVISGNDDILDDKVKLSNLNLIAIKLYNSDTKKKIYLFQRYVHPTVKYRNSFKYILNGRTAKLFKGELVTINTSVDAILYEDNYYILNRNSFNTMFNFKDVFYKIIDDNKEKITESNLFVSADKFIEDCTQDGRYLPRLTKVILANGFDSANDHKNKLPELIQQYKLSFSLKEDNRIDYTDKKQIKDIIDVLLEHFVISALTEKKMLAKAIEKYEL